MHQSEQMFAHNVLFCQVVKQPAKKYSQAVKPIWLLVCFQAGLLHISKIKFSLKPSCRIISEPVWCTDCPPNAYVYEVASTQSYDYLQPYKTQQQLSHTEKKIQGAHFRHFVYIVSKLCFFILSLSVWKRAKYHTIKCPKIPGSGWEWFLR